MQLLCHVMLTQYLVLHWLVYSLFCWIWLTGHKLSNFLNNIDTCIVAVVKVSDDTIQLIINWTIRQIMTRQSHCISKSIFRKCQSFLKNWQTFLWILARLTRRKKANNFPCWKKRNMNGKEVMLWKKNIKKHQDMVECLGWVMIRQCRNTRKLKDTWTWNQYSSYI